MERKELIQLIEKARHDLVTCHNCTATDRPDLMNIPQELSWTVDNSDGIKALDKALMLLDGK